MLTWLIDVLDREIAGVTGADRDRIAKAIIEALPVRTVAIAITQSAATQLRAHGVSTEEDRAAIARDIGNNAAMAVSTVLDPFIEEEDELADCERRERVQ